MFVIHEDMTIYATRGDAVYFQLEKKNGDAKYKFQPGDIVRFKVFAKKNCGKVVLMKDFLIEEESTAVNIFLDRGDMKFGEIISKPVDYWYEAELNPDTFPDTFVGYDADGPKLFKLFPEAKDVTEGEIDDPEESGAVERMVVTFVNEYLDKNAEETIVNTVEQYIYENPIKDGKDGVDGKDGKDGKDGTDGFSPIAKVTETDSGAVITITDAEGTTTATVKNGHDGTDGKDGKTPVKGVEYYTEAEKQEIVDAVLEKVPEHTETIKLIAEAMPKVSAINFSNFESGSFTETVDGSSVNHSVSFDDEGRPTMIDDIVIAWG